MVANGDNFENKYVILDTDLSFTSNNSYVDATRTDMGDINGDGKNYKLKNYIINNNTGIDSISGLFSRNTGTIKDFTIENANLTNVNNSFDGTTLLCIYNDGIIENCKLVGEIKLENIEKFAGIYMENNGTISKCENQTNISDNFNNGNSYIQVAGICMTNNANIVLSSNNGNIIAKNYSTESNIETRARKLYTTYVSGISYNNYDGTIIGCNNIGKLEALGKEGFQIAGIAFGGNIYNSYNTGNFKGISLDKTKAQRFSGIAIDPQIISNCYNTGKFEIDDNSFGMIEGNTDYADVTNYYYLENILPEQEKIDSITEMTEQDMKSDNFVNTLNTNAEQLGKEGRFIRDDNQNNGYPIIEK